MNLGIKLKNTSTQNSIIIVTQILHLHKPCNEYSVPYCALQGKGRKVRAQIKNTTEKLEGLALHIGGGGGGGGREEGENQDFS